MRDMESAVSGALHHVELWVPDLDRAVAGHGWNLLFADRHPFAGDDDHYVAYLENQDGFEVELVAIAWTSERPEQV